MRKNLRKWILLLLAGLFILSCFFVSPEKFSVESDLPFFLNFSFLYYFPLEKYFYMATILILSSYLLESRVLSYIAYPILRFAKTRKALSHILIFLSFGIALLFGTSISMFFTLPLSAITLGKEDKLLYESVLKKEEGMMMEGEDVYTALCKMSRLLMEEKVEELLPLMEDYEEKELSIARVLKD